MQARTEKACLDVLSRLDADLPLSAIQGHTLTTTLVDSPRHTCLEAYYYIHNILNMLNVFILHGYHTVPYWYYGIGATL